MPMRTPWPSPQAPAPLSRYSQTNPRELARPTICPAGTIESQKKNASAQARRQKPERQKPSRPPRLRVQKPGRTSRTVGIVMLGLAVGTAVGYVMNDRFGGGPAVADTTAVLAAEALRPAEPAPPKTTVAPIAARIDPVVERFAWDSTCAVALTGLTAVDDAAVADAFAVARDQATLFEPGIVPTDVVTALEAGHEVPGDLGANVQRTCTAWTERIGVG